MTEAASIVPTTMLQITPIRALVSSDADDDEWDELKPDITSYGSSIMSATAQTGTSFPGQPAKPLAGSDYDEKDGTSMATPIASGIVALMLQADPSLEPQEVKDILRNSSEQRGSASEPSVSDRWNDEWGFGLIDASCAIDTVLEKACTPLEGGGGVTPPPPSGNGSENNVTINYPINGSWFVEGDMVRISGSLIGTNISEYDEVQITIEQRNTQNNSVNILKDWTLAGGELPDWFLDVSIKSDWVDPSEDYTLVMARAINQGGDGTDIVVRTVNKRRGN